jgi:hypothetical protein
MAQQKEWSVRKCNSIEDPLGVASMDCTTNEGALAATTETAAATAATTAATTEAATTTAT